MQTQILNTSLTDLEDVYSFFDHSIAYQEKHGYTSWRNYDRNAVIKDIKNGDQYKVTIDGRTGIVFSAYYADKVIWRHHDQGDAVYLHRIVVNPAFKGQKLFGVILDWATEQCRHRKLKNVRMDTWASNPGIVEYYKGFGFRVIEDFTTPDTEDLPVHNRKLALTLLEYTPL
ncbi:MAG TPA: GNAT family N-acetyltransferase [Cyclobacteriaceae bacterium]|nr:GNAT family N-acetyltransferase [Cyclobacteriaceae bacterium]